MRETLLVAAGLSVAALLGAVGAMWGTGWLIERSLGRIKW